MAVDLDLIRKRLISLQYGNLVENINSQAAPLIQKLLVDLISTTEAYQQAQASTQKVYSLQERVVPLQRKVQDLQEENAGLHEQVIGLKDARDREGRMNLKVVKTLQERYQSRPIQPIPKGLVADNNATRDFK
jgi:septation ring formation regulator EzrA